MLHKLEKITEKRKTIGRGGDRGGTSGKGHKGQKARSGGGVSAQFEGGQSPLTRRLPKRGFTNANFKIIFETVSLTQLSKIATEKNIEEITKAILVEEGIISKVYDKVKILANGVLDKKITVHVNACSKSALTAIELLGGKVMLQ